MEVGGREGDVGVDAGFCYFLLFHSWQLFLARQHLLVDSLGGYLTGTSKESIQLNLRSMLMCFRLRIYCEL